MFVELLACPVCEGALDAELHCHKCRTRFGVIDGVANLRVMADARTEAVRKFYERAPFPGYPPRDSLEWLRTRAERSEFARLLDRAIPGDARILDAGCGTGQMALYLARANRVVIGADMTHASLSLAVAAAKRFGVDRVQFVETDLQRPGLRNGAFDVVYSSGVLHHTPNPRASFARLAKLAKPGGMIVVGLYNAFARFPFKLRRLLARIVRKPVFDPVLRDRQNEPERREAWFRDQYQHPEEHSHTLTEVQTWFEENGVEYIRAFPSAVLANESSELFEPAGDNWKPEAWLAQLGWMRSLGHEGGLFMTIGQRL